MQREYGWVGSRLAGGLDHWTTGGHGSVLFLEPL